MPVTGDDEQGQPPEAPWHHSTPAVAGASAAALAVIGLVVWVAVSLTGSGGPEDAPIDFVPPTYTSTSKTTKSTTTRTTTNRLPMTTEFGGPSDTSSTSSSETSETSTSETSPTSTTTTTTTTTTTESGNPGYGEYPTTTYHRPRTNVTRTLYPVPGG